MLIQSIEDGLDGVVAVSKVFTPVHERLLRVELCMPPVGQTNAMLRTLFDMYNGRYQDMEPVSQSHMIELVCSYLGYSKATLGRMLGVSPRTLQAMSAGNRGMRAWPLACIARMMLGRGYHQIGAYAAELAKEADRMASSKGGNRR